MNDSFMSHQKLRRLTLTMMLVAVTVVISRIFLIPIPLTRGNVNLCDAGIFLTALSLGPREGATVGALTGFILDLLSGYAQYMFFSLAIHGIEGLVVGLLATKFLGKAGSALVLCIGTLIMVSGYFGSDSLLYGISMGLIGIPANLIQGMVGAIVAFFLNDKIGGLLRR